MTLGKDKDWDNLGYSEDEIPHLSAGEWDAARIVVTTSPHEIKAVEQLESITKLVTQWTDGLVLATEATDEMKRILLEKGV